MIFFKYKSWGSLSIIFFFFAKELLCTDRTNLGFEQFKKKKNVFLGSSIYCNLVMHVCKFIFSHIQPVWYKKKNPIKSTISLSLIHHKSMSKIFPKFSELLYNWEICRILRNVLSQLTNYEKPQFQQNIVSTRLKYLEAQSLTKDNHYAIW